MISRPIDFLGVNYYNPTYVRDVGRSAAAARDRRRRAGTTTAMGWPVDAGGLHDLLAAAARRLRRPGDLDHRERRRVRRRDSWSTASSRIPRASRILPTIWTALRPRGRRRRRRAPLPRLVAARQLRVGARLRQALRDRARGLRHAGADPEAERALVPRSHRCGSRRWCLMASIAFEDVSKVFADGTRAVDGLDLEIADGEFTILVGPSGLGQVDGAADGRGARGRDGGRRSRSARGSSTTSRRKDRDIAMVFQSYALYPHMSVAENMGFALKLAKQPKAVDRVAGAAAPPRGSGSASCSSGGRRRCRGGQRQRVALGRAIVRSPAGVPDGRAVVEPRREAARGDARLHRAAAPGAGDDDACTSPTTRPRR